MNALNVVKTWKLNLIFLSILQCFSVQTYAETEKRPSSLSEKGIKMNVDLTLEQQAIIPIAAFTAVGNLPKLADALQNGLNQGLTINEIKAVLAQSYAYVGFPRSLNALNTFMTVLEQRKQQNIQDIKGREASQRPDHYQALIQGIKNQTELVGQPVQGEIFEFSPEINQYLKAHLFGDIFSNDLLTWQDREIVTISMLATLDGVESQLRSHINIGKYQGLSVTQLKNISTILSEDVSYLSSQRLQKELSQ